MNSNQLSYIPIMAPLLASAFMMLSKIISPKKIKTIIFYFALFLGFIIPIIIICFILIQTYHEGTIETVIGGYNKGIGITYTFTHISSIISLLALIITFVSYLYDSRNARKRPEFVLLLFIQLSSIIMAVSTRDLFNLFVALEVMGITSYVLIAISQNIKASIASLSYLFVSSTMMIFFLLGTYGIYRMTGSLDYSIIKERLLSVDNSLFLFISAGSIIAGIILRSAIIGLHFWLPSAHAMAKHSVSALLSGLVIKIPIIILFYLLPIFPFSKQLGSFLSIGGIITALVGVLYAYSQSDAKKLLAYHSVSQMGYIIASFGASFQLGLDTPTGKILYVASISHIVFHSLFKSTLFLSVGTVIDLLENRNVYYMRSAAKILLLHSKTHIITILSFFIATFCIIALPPFNGFYSKYLITNYISSKFAFISLFITSAFTVASFIKLSNIFFSKNSVIPPLHRHPVANRKRIKALFILMILLIVSSLGAPWLIKHLMNDIGGEFQPHFFSSGSLIKVVVTILLGIGIFLSKKLPVTKILMRSIEKRTTSFQTTMVFIPLSLTALCIYLFLVV